MQAIRLPCNCMQVRQDISLVGPLGALVQELVELADKFAVERAWGLDAEVKQCKAETVQPLLAENEVRHSKHDNDALWNNTRATSFGVDFQFSCSKGLRKNIFA